METSSASFLHLLGDISQVLSRRGESEADYEDLLRQIFNNGGLHDAALQRYISASMSELDNNLLWEILKKAGVHDDPALESEVNVEHLPIPKAEKVFGREHEMRKLLHKCCNMDEEERIQLSGIPIVGPAEVGKTTLARLIYEDELVKKHFEIQVWVELNGHELSLHHAAQQILKSTMGMACSGDEFDEMVGDILLGQRCLIVFDGVDSLTSDHWFHMNKYWFDSVDLGSIVLITTPSKDVANLVSDDAFELKQLLPDDGWSLYQYHSFGNAAFMRDALRNIAALCGYIPLLLKLVGGVMRYDDKLRRLFLGANFSDAISLPAFDESVVVLLCVWALTPQLRQCLAFCASLPEGYVVNREKIINMWAAHGLVKPSPENNLRDIGDFYIHQLFCRSFFIDIARNEYGDITEFRMPGLIHKIMHDVAGIVWMGKVGEIGSISENAHQLSLNSEGQENVRALILIADCGCKKLPSLGQLPHLKELHLKGMTNIQNIGLEFYGGGVSDAFPSLEQLGLYDMPALVLWSDAMVSGDVCRSLKTLTIEGCPMLEYIPTFRNLLDLIVCSCNVKILLSSDYTRFGPPPSLLIRNMYLGKFLEYPAGWRSVKKLILSNCTPMSDFQNFWMLGYLRFQMSEITELEHLCIERCPRLRTLEMGTKNSFQKLHVVDCRNLSRIQFTGEAANLTELVVDGCPGLRWSYIKYLKSLTKLIIRGIDKFLPARDFVELKKLEYLSINECPLLEIELEIEPHLISHIQCALLGNRKAQYMDDEDLADILKESEIKSYLSTLYSDEKSEGVVQGRRRPVLRKSSRPSSFQGQRSSSRSSHG